MSALDPSAPGLPLAGGGGGGGGAIALTGDTTGSGTGTIATTTTGLTFASAAVSAANRAVLGGEPSGHLIRSDLGATGDGTLAGLHVAALVAGTGTPGHGAVGGEHQLTV